MLFHILFKKYVSVFAYINNSVVFTNGSAVSLFRGQSSVKGGKIWP